MAGKSNPINNIVQRFGGQSALARALGTKQSTVWEWVNSGSVPFARVTAIIEAGKRSNPPICIQTSDFFGITESQA